jgi:hypothetical protein
MHTYFLFGTIKKPLGIRRRGLENNGSAETILFEVLGIKAESRFNWLSTGSDVVFV